MNNENQEKPKYVGRGGWRGGGRPRTRGGCYSFRGTPEVDAILASVSHKSEFINEAIAYYAQRKESAG